jgi:formyl-CoA transferase
MSYSAATDSVLERLIRVVLGEDALQDERFATVEARRANTSTVQSAVSSWIGTRTKQDVEGVFKENEAVIGEVFTIETIWNDEGYRARENIVAVDDAECGTVNMHGVVPRFVGRPGEIRSTGPALGEHTDDVLLELAQVEEQELSELRRDGVI